MIWYVSAYAFEQLRQFHTIQDRHLGLAIHMICSDQQIQQFLPLSTLHKQVHFPPIPRRVCVVSHVPGILLYKSNRSLCRGYCCL